LSDEELAQRLETATLRAKVSPARKARIIAALHRRHHVVAFPGDGINDVPP
jgi:Mg2+-importing ATPase